MIFPTVSEKHQLMYLKQAVPEDAKMMLYHNPVKTVDKALKLLTNLEGPVIPGQSSFTAEELT